MTDETTEAKKGRRAAPSRKGQPGAAVALTSGRLSNTRERDELVDEICGRLAAGESVRAIFRNRAKGYPSGSRFWSWIGLYPEVRARFDRALIIRSEKYAEEITELADEQPPLVDGHVDSGWVVWQRNRVDSRKWVASRLMPQKYGDRTILAGDPERPVALATSIIPTLHNLSTPEKQALLKLLRKAISGQPQERLAVEGQVFDGDADDGATSEQEI
jgi:hypothetical protein